MCIQPIQQEIVMTAAKPAVLITGATGQVGRAVLKALSTDPELMVTGAGRNPQAITAAGYHAVALDYDDPQSVAAALQGVDRLLLVTAYTVDMLRHSKLVVDLARQVGVKYIVHLGAPGADDTRVDHYGWHQFIERYIEWSGIACTHLRPEIFMQNLFGYGGVPVVDQGVLRYFVGDARLSWVDADDIADVAAICLRLPDRHAGMTYRLGHDAKSYPEVAAAFTKVLGQPFRYEPQDPKAFLERVLASGGDPAYMACVYRSFDELGRGVAEPADEVFPTYTAVTGKNPTTIEDFALKHAAVFRY
jgi:NAD(P)H dehydrogenase (quinone)